jgi:hypothetical protein
MRIAIISILAFSALSFSLPAKAETSAEGEAVALFGSTCIDALDNLGSVKTRADKEKWLSMRPSPPSAAAPPAKSNDTAAAGKPAAEPQGAPAVVTVVDEDWQIKKGNVTYRVQASERKIHGMRLISCSVAAVPGDVEKAFAELKLSPQIKTLTSNPGQSTAWMIRQGKGMGTVSLNPTFDGTAKGFVISAIVQGASVEEKK